VPSNVTLCPSRPRAWSYRAPFPGSDARWPENIRLKWRGEGSSSAFYFNFNNGKRNSNDLTNRNNNRVLCVRRSGA
jgi:hypothetical protein